MEDNQSHIGLDEPVNFYELTGISKPKKHEQLPGETPKEFLARINDPTKWVYGCPVRDKMLLSDPYMLPRFASLSRKAFMHYGGEHYNPHTISMMSELFIRTIIKESIEYKVQGKTKNYDWELLNNLFIKFIRDELNLPMPDGYKMMEREILPEFRSPFHHLNIDTSN